jgi:hypothetical protein
MFVSTKVENYLINIYCLLIYQIYSFLMKQMISLDNNLNVFYKDFNSIFNNINLVNNMKFKLMLLFKNLIQN